MIVVDTNIIAYLYLTGDRSQQVAQLLEADPIWASPVLWRSEFRSVLSQYLRNDLLSLDDVLVILAQAEQLLAGNEYHISSTQVMDLVRSSSCSAYDCEFVALAQQLQVPLITADKKLLEAFADTAMSLERYPGNT
ncbi:MAG TPA: VapC toxin family PIN domain ribonuclease [Gammaproteobacteria bacterium]|nr:VapC toxin family PIN domain ribonuclease [Gammaproteobacteria bacterium]